MDLLRFASEMSTAMYQCGQAARALKGQVAERHKAADSPHQESTAVTVVDTLCQEILLLAAYAYLPEIEVYSEELASCPAEVCGLFEGNHHRYALILDPVDGTDDFTRGANTYAHVVALLDQETARIDCGLIYFPELGRFYAGLRGVGVFCSEALWGAPQRVRPVPPPKTVGDVKRLHPNDRAAFERLGYEVVPSASRSAAYELIRVVEGQMGASVMRQFHGHDSAAASVMIELLGGAMLVEGGQPVRYDKTMPRMPVVITSVSPEYARELSEVLVTPE